MAKAKKNKKEKPFTPEDLNRMNEKSAKDRLYGKYGAVRNAEGIEKDKRKARTAFLILIIIILILLILWLLSFLMTKNGDLVISVDRGLRTQGIVMSETKDFSKTAIQLDAENVSKVTNITYDWLPKDLDKHDGSHNGKNYLAYTFYVRNNGENTVSYKGTMNITGVASGMDEAVRIQVYKNGNPVTYAKGKLGNRKAAEPGTVKFVDNATVMTTVTKDFAPGQTDKYTFIIWLEGNDSECINDILGGYMRSQVIFQVADEGDLSGKISV